MFDEEMEEAKNLPDVLEIYPATVLLTKQNVAQFHEKMRSSILESGYGMLEYIESIKFFCKLNEHIFGGQGKEGDKDFVAAMITEVSKFGKDYKTARGVKFEVAETGVSYDYSGNPAWVAAKQQEEQAKAIRTEIEQRLKFIPAGKSLVDEDTGEILCGPAKTSKSSIKVTLPKQ